ncbi:Xaa-Pro aminopeptidase [Legionella londiniensis]|uniref:Xaa-Pro aminopeptidase n=1 Tax=Legionella londiniensis TaxID=45068 RepID=A0A0W0VP26_9GAMM|nr:Xaa-Pro aminopeptidase [Legionella londiniensis]KTD21786.1 Xaa-Pro aminopeptidase [Legionella londiniensis]STX92162.1 Xaa-Pro aminopeptidase [Legionella londiniensis]
MLISNEFLARRRKLAQKILPDSVAIIPAASDVLRNGDAYYRFRQDSDFYYLTGFNEPDALLAVFAGKGESVLFNLPKDLAQEQWTGERLGQENACATLGVDEAFSLDSLTERLPELLAGRTAIYYPIGRYPAFEKRIFKSWQLVKQQTRRGDKAPEAFYDLGPLLGEMRLVKSAAEIGLMKKAAAISVNAHKRAMQACRKAQYEYELEAELIYELTRRGCRSVAYDPIVAGGKNACILHYTANNQPLARDDLILIDAGGEYENYAADITRTFPKSGKFSPEQRQIYELVREAHKAGVQLVRPGCRWDDIQQVIVRILTTGLVELGILKGGVDDLLAEEAYRPFYMHRSGHWLGLDVHDSGNYKEGGDWRRLEPGMVLTVEPGLYIHPQIKDIDRKWSGIGVRIEDDILVTENGHENITADLPADAAEIEAFIRG